MDRCRRCLCFCLSKNRLLLSESMDAKCINLTIMVVYIKHKERQRNFHLIVFSTESTCFDILEMN